MGRSREMRVLNLGRKMPKVEFRGRTNQDSTEDCNNNWNQCQSNPITLLLYISAKSY